MTRSCVVGPPRRLGLLLLVVMAALAVASASSPAQDPSDPEAVLDHYLCYDVLEQPPEPRLVELSDQFGGPHRTEVIRDRVFCNPAQKFHGPSRPPHHPDAHLRCHDTRDELEPFPPPPVKVRNQFGEEVLTALRPVALCAPAIKFVVDNAHRPTPPLDAIQSQVDHFRCYGVEPSGPGPGSMPAEDQFGFQHVILGRAELLCNPVTKVHHNRTFLPRHVDAHLVCYEVVDPSGPQRFVGMQDQFSRRGLQTTTTSALCVPSSKEVIDEEPPLDHFKAYQVKEHFQPQPARLDDQFTMGREVLVNAPVLLLNPVEKRRRTGAVTPVSRPDAHLKCHRITDGSGRPMPPEGRTVAVANQFGEQRLDVLDARLLCAPASKGDPDADTEPGAPPAGLDHFECYGVANPRPPFAEEGVLLTDQFLTEDVLFGEPRLLCNPAAKHRGTEVGEIKRPDEHLVCYEITPIRKDEFDRFKQLRVLTRDQFGLGRTRVHRPEALCVPSTKQVIL